MKVRKAVITVAGWGTRFLPVTRSQPKEMLPLVDKPLIQYAVEEAVASGIEQVIMVTASNKRAIEDYFDRCYELEDVLEKKGQTDLLREMRSISSMADVSYVRQKEQLGLGHAVLTARNAVGNEPFAVILPDDIIDSPVLGLKQMLAVFERYEASVVAVERVDDEAISRYGAIEPVPVADRVYEVRGLVEKPEPAQAPSNLGVVGRYILMPEIFAAIESVSAGEGGEVQLTDAIQALLKKQKVYACEFEGVRYDTGNPLGWLQANIALALQHPEYAPALRDYMRRYL